MCLLIGLSLQILSQEVERYENKDKKYSIDFPKGWVTAYDKNALVGILAANDGKDITKQLMVVTAKSIALSTKEAYKANLRSIKSDKKNTVEEEGVATINGMEAMWAVYSFEKEGEKTKVKFYLIKNGKTQHVIQSVMPAADFDATIVLHDSIIATFNTL